MSWKSMETDILARCSMDWKQVEIGLSTDLLPPGWASYEENLSRNIYAFLKFTLALALSFSVYRSRKRIQERNIEI